MKIADLYRQVTNRIVAELEAGVVPWVKPWQDGRTGGLMPRNAATGRPYSGINIPILWDAAHRCGYPRHEWLTFRQASSAGAVVRRGERGTAVVFTRRIIARAETPEDDERVVSMLRTYAVFNVAQIDGWVEKPEPVLPEHPPILVAERFVHSVGADIRHGGNRACYIPSRDLIAMPEARQFESAAHYFATALHELTHWTGHETRLDRVLANRFGSGAYAAEELVAEFGAAFLCAELGITGRLRHADYIGSWLELLKADGRAVFTAASKASQAASYLRVLSGQAAEFDA